MNIRHLLTWLSFFCAVLLLSACGKPDKPSVPLYLALQRGDIAQIERHIYWGADLNKINPDGSMPLHAAAKTGRLVVVELLLDNDADINIRDAKNHTPIHEALMSGRTQIARMLIKRGAEFDANWLLEEAVNNQVADRDVIEFLIQRGAEINHTAENGDTPLHMAVKQDNRVLSKLLIAHGANVNSKDATNHTPLWHAIGRHNRDIVKLLKRNGAIVE